MTVASIGSARSRAKARPRVVFLHPLLLLLPLLFSGNVSAVLQDRTLAVVGNQVVTRYDLKVEWALGQMVDRGTFPILNSWEGLSDEELGEIRERAIRHVLILQYADSTGIVGEPAPDRVAEMRKKYERVGSAERRTKLQADLDVSPARLEQFLSNRARVEMFLRTHVPLQVNPTPEEIRRHYEKEKDARFLGKPFAEVEALVKTDLHREMSRREFEKWLETEKRRTEIVRLPLSASPTPSAD